MTRPDRLRRSEFEHNRIRRMIDAATARIFQTVLDRAAAIGLE